MDVERIRQKFDAAKSKHNIDFEAKEEQLKIAMTVMSGRNVLGLLPTGYGKTLCMLIPTMLSEEKSITLVISPLTSLIDDQMCSLKSKNFSCAKISAIGDMDNAVISGITNGDFSFVFSSPESVLNSFWKSIFLSKKWQSCMKLIAIDEAHCVSEWGDDFRKEYQQLFELRSFFKVPVMALTATSTKKVKVDIMEHLQLMEDNTDVIFKSPDKPNLFLEIAKKESTEYETCLSWLIEHIRVKGSNSKKTIIYCRSIDTVSEIFCTLKDCLGKMAYVDGKIDSQHILLEMYHTSTHQDSKDRITNEFKKCDSHIRCIVATVALGMGLDIRDVDLVMHIGCPKTLVSYWQETGRCARDGRAGYSLVLYDKFTLSLKTTEKEVAQLILNKDEKCIRQEIIKFLTDDEIVVEVKPSEKCNGSCDLQCQCSMCKSCSICKKKCHVRKT